jgi:hypothetical protein
MCRTTTLISLLGLTVAWASGCGGNIGQYTANVTLDAGGMPDGPAMEIPLPDPCQAPDAGELPPAPPGCMAPPNACMIDMAMPPGSCLFTALRASVLPVFKDCGVGCGAINVAFRDGCMTAVFVVGDVIGAPTGPSAAVLCLRQRLLGTSWSCAPPDGWIRIFVDGCLTP